MEITQLKYFYALAQNQHVTRTAEQLNIAQPSLTQSIRRLEKELNVKLFKTNGRNIVLTECGKYLQRKIEPLLKTQKKTKAQIEKDSRNKKGLKSFSVRTNAERIEKLNKKLLKDNKTKVEFLNEAIDEYTKKD